MTSNFTRHITAAVFAVLFSGSMLLAAFGPGIGTQPVAAPVSQA